MSTVIPCRAKDPTTCKYHGAERRAETAFAAGDIEAYLIAHAEMTAAIKTTAEVIDFFAAKSESYGTVADRFNAHLAELNPSPELQAAVAKASENPADRARNIGTQAARRSLNSRIRAAIDNGERYNVGGTPEATADVIMTDQRIAYQDAAEVIIKNAGVYATGGGTWRASDGKDSIRLGKFEAGFANRTQAAVNEASERENYGEGISDGIENAYDRAATVVRQAFANNKLGPDDLADIKPILVALDKAYWR